MNKVFLTGNIGKEPELRDANGTSVCSFSLATNESYTNKQGERIEKSEWHNIVVWGKRAEVINQYCGKGDQLIVEGKLETRKWDDKDGNTRYTTQVLLMGFDFGKKAGSGNVAAAAPQAQTTQAPQQQPQGNEPPPGFDDLPF